jgi:hypothetical protein
MDGATDKRTHILWLRPKYQLRMEIGHSHKWAENMNLERESSECMSNKELKTIEEEKDGHKMNVPKRFSAPSVLFAVHL